MCKSIHLVNYPILSVLFFSLFIHSSKAQNSPNINPVYIKAALHPLGYVIPHSEELGEVNLRNPLGFQLETGWHLSTQKTWNQCRCYPRTGFTFSFFDYRNPEVLGQSYTLSSFIEPFLAYSGRVKASFRLGAGLTYLNQVYDSLTNPTNLFYSAPLSFMLRAQLNLHYELSPNWELGVSGHFQHISNGGISKPNKGMNYPTASFNVTYLPNTLRLEKRNKAVSIDSLYSSRWQKRLFLVSGLKEVSPTEEQKYPAVGTTFYVSRILSRMNALFFGGNYLWDGSLRQRRLADTASPIRDHTLSVLAGHEFLMGRFIFSQAMGAYLYKPTPNSDRLYHRWGLYYRITPKTLVGFNLKAHRHVADILDFRIGYTW